MSPKAAAILTNPHPCGHLVYPYTDEDLMAQAVSLYASAGLKNEEAVVLIMTEAHHSPIDARLKAEGFDTGKLLQTGQLTYTAAESSLSVLMVAGMPDQHLFRTIIGGMLDRAENSATKGESRRIRAFGEMVSLLWVDNVPAAKRLEEFWDETIKLYSASLLCTYALNDAKPKSFPPELIACHTHNIAHESVFAHA